MKKYKIRFHRTKHHKKISMSYSITGWADSEEEFLADLKKEFPESEVFPDSLMRLE